MSVFQQGNLLEGMCQEVSSALFSPCRAYRYLLTRVWDPSLPIICFIMCNPSTADEVANDPTVERCQRRAVALGAGGLIVVNIFALRSTDPAALYVAEDPIGPENDSYIIQAAQSAQTVICAWSKNGQLKGRALHVRELLDKHGVKLHALRFNKDGSPEHPLYIPYSVSPVLWELASTNVENPS